MLRFSNIKLFCSSFFQPNNYCFLNDSKPKRTNLLIKSIIKSCRLSTFFSILICLLLLLKLITSGSRQTQKCYPLPQKCFHGYGQCLLQLEYQPLSNWDLLEFQSRPSCATVIYF